MAAHPPVADEGRRPAAAENVAAEVEPRQRVDVRGQEKAYHKGELGFYIIINIIIK